MKTKILTLLLALGFIASNNQLQAQSCNACQFNIINMIDCEVVMDIHYSYVSGGITYTASVNHSTGTYLGTATSPGYWSPSPGYFPPMTICSNVTILSVDILSIGYTSLGGAKTPCLAFTNVPCPPSGTSGPSYSLGGTTCCCTMGHNAQFSNCTLILTMVCPS